MGKFQYVSVVNKIISSIMPSTTSFYYNPLPLSDIENINTCPVCNQKIYCNPWQHILACKHYDFIKQQLQFAADLFYNQWYNGQNIKGLYMTFNKAKYYWKKWYKIQTCTRLNSINWLYFEKHNYQNPNLDFDYKTGVCPVCKEHFLTTNKNFLYSHIFKHWYEPTHNDLLCQLIGDMLNRDYWENPTTLYSLDTYKDCLINTKGRAYYYEIKDKHCQTTHSWGIRGYRPDIGVVCNSTWEANVYRIIKYLTKQDLNWKRGIDYEIPFDISTKEKRQTYIVDFFDKYGIFQKNAYVEIKGQYTDDAKYKKKKFKELYNLPYIMIGIPTDNFHPEIDYNELCEKYKNVIPYWGI